MPKFAMHNDPKIRHKKYNEKKIFRAGHNARRMDAERERERELSKSITGVTWAKGKSIDDPGIDDTSRKILAAQPEAGISIFDPVLCELAYRWFTKKDSIILDPFSGGSVRGIVAAKLERNYIGIDLRKEQIDANKDQAKDICNEYVPTWHCGNSLNIKNICSDVKADFIFSCPPYGDLEVYSDDPEDISTMGYDDFKKTYFEIIKNSCDLLKQDRFACFVVGDFRDKKGNYRNFVSHTIDAFLNAGLHLYNEAILVTAVGSLPIRAGRTFQASRKLGKTHQNVLIFVKGDGKSAAKELGELTAQEFELATSSTINGHLDGLLG